MTPTRTQTSTQDRAAATAALRELILAGEHYRLAAAAHLDLTVNESRAVSYLLARGSLGQTELAQALGLTTSSTTTLVDRLERRGLIERVPDQVDRRRSTVRIPEAGMAQVGQVRDWMPHTLDTLDPATLPQVTEVLTTIADALRSVAAEIHAAGPSTRGTRRRH
ncbi:MarR family winged helix-turn-helix transcriptional regulator [Intrasporangium sp. YIM S08009]|uniref:MarR family winged helix-turn-helix transcriptional regulator n=1 Tax=Intrasporangium zincisolvens TaxID=3080018 RepID=UPI002B054AF7|nr:MarR family winged helix-turn-helix transcriptional regulator [Intrasporangium sp. YIM S08009]